MILTAAAAALVALVSPLDLPIECNVPTYAIHKPRGVLSRTGKDTDANANAETTKHSGALTTCTGTRTGSGSGTGTGSTGSRRTLTDLMVAAGLQPLSKHIGRLDLETGGLILVTADALLLEAALSMPGATSLRPQIDADVDADADADAIALDEKERNTETTKTTTKTTSAPTPFQPLEKTYELLLAGKYQHDAAAIEELRTPLTHSRAGKEYHSESATVRFIRCFQNEELATEYSLLDCHDDDGDEKDGAIETRRGAIRAERGKAIVSRQTGELVRPFTFSDGWLTEVAVTIHQGRHHQIRRLCTRAGLKLRHLRRVSFGPIELGSMHPGDVRVLGVEEKAKLYRACVPCLEGAHDRRLQAMDAARKARIDRTDADRPTDRKRKERTC